MEVGVNYATYIQFVVQQEVLYLLQLVGGLAPTVNQASGTVPEAHSTSSFTPNVAIIGLGRVVGVAGAGSKPQT